MNNIEDKIAQKIGQQTAEDHAGLAAAASPTPGATRDAFAIQPAIPVGKFSVRPFYDIDFVFMAQLGHPLVELRPELIIRKDQKQIDEEFSKMENFLPTGEHAWNLYFMLTRPAREVRDTIRAKGITGMKDAAADEFGEMQFNALKELLEASIKQFCIYWSTTIEYGAKAEGEKTVSQNPSPASSEAP